MDRREKWEMSKLSPLKELALADANEEAKPRTHKEMRKRLEAKVVQPKELFGPSSTSSS